MRSLCLDTMPLPNSNPNVDRLKAARLDGTIELADDLSYLRLAVVNVVLCGKPGCGDREWTLIDTGIAGLTGMIEKAAAARFGTGARPAAVIVTHAHFDHAGGLARLAKLWGAPIFAHSAELPFLNGECSYAPPDGSVGGGFIPLVSRFLPRKPLDVRPWLDVLPEDGTVPSMPGWAWVATPGHSPGHISLWREEDGTLIAGDALCTTEQESAYSVAVHAPEIHGPPNYCVPDWKAAERSVRVLNALEPELVVAGHGRPMRGTGMLMELQRLANDFRRRGMPGEWSVQTSARDAAA